MIGNYRIYSSQIEDDIYELMEEYMCGIDIYEYILTDAIADYFLEHRPIVEWKLACTQWPNCEGGACAISWVEDGNLNMIMFDYKV